MKSPEQQRVQWKRWYAKAKNDSAWCARRLAAKRAAYQRDNTVVTAGSKRWVAANREKVRATWRRFYAAHQESERQRIKNRDPQKRREANRQWALANPLKRATNESKRRALKKGTAVGPVDYALVVRASGGICALCDQPVINEVGHIDHIVPLARGGTHTQDNVQFTHGRCNAIKGVKLLRKVG